MNPTARACLLRHHSLLHSNLAPRWFRAISRICSNGPRGIRDVILSRILVSVNESKWNKRKTERERTDSRSSFLLFVFFSFFLLLSTFFHHFSSKLSAKHFSSTLNFNGHGEPTGFDRFFKTNTSRLIWSVIHGARYAELRIPYLRSIITVYVNTVYFRGKIRVQEITVVIDDRACFYVAYVYRVME